MKAPSVKRNVYLNTSELSETTKIVDYTVVTRKIFFGNSFPDISPIPSIYEGERIHYLFYTSVVDILNYWRDKEYVLKLLASLKRRKIRFYEIEKYP